MISVYLFPLLVAVFTIGGFEAGAIQIECSDPNERCLPIRHCPPVYKQVVKNEHKRNITFKMELKNMICEPETQMETKTHICCPKLRIECRLNGEPGACLLREQCPTLQSITEEELMRSAEQNLCYVHEQKNYFCCTDPLCASNKNLCAQPDFKDTKSAFPKCKKRRGVVGSLVPKRICSEQAHSGWKTIDDRVCCVRPKPDRLIAHRNAAKLAQLPCGTVKLDTNYYSPNAKPGEFPWMAILVYYTHQMCSGTVIHPQYVLTTRHCINPWLSKVLLGMHDLLENSKQELQWIDISKTFKSNTHDVGLLRLARPATIGSDHVRSICLPIYSSLQMYLPSPIMFTGWSQTEAYKPMSVLRKAYTPVLMSGEGCNEDHMICVGGVNNSNPCAGDSGGPFQALSKFGNNSEKYVQYGIITDGPAICSRPVRPSRGVMVGYVIDWILDHMIL